MKEKYTKTVFAMIKANRMHRRVIESIALSTGIHHSQHRLLMYIARNGGSDSQKKIAEHMGISCAAVTNCLSTLEKSGFIKRHSGEDGRYNEIEITDSGRGIVERSRERFSEVDASVLADFSDDEIDTLRALLERIEKNAEQILDNREKKDDEMV